MSKPGDWVRGLLRPRLAVFTTQATSGRTPATMVAVRLTTTTERVVRAGIALSWAAVLGLGLFVWPDSFSGPVTVGLLAVVAATRTRGSTTLADAPLARAAIRAALTEGAEHTAQHWRIEGPAAVELGRELVRLQSLWLPGHAAQSGELDRARATMIANEANARITPYLGALSLAEHQAWLGAPESLQLTGNEPDNPAEYHRDGAAWPSLNEPEAGTTWPTLPERDRP